MSSILSNNYIYNNNNNIGIFTSNPSTTLDINGNMNITEGATLNSIFCSYINNNVIYQGLQGLQGFQGVMNYGLQGVQGTQGNGIQGSNGIIGFQGIQGLFGTQGIQGAQGFIGTQGIIGLQGFIGAQGIGSQGNQGNQGNQGFMGVLSYITSVSSVAGASSLVLAYQGLGTMSATNWTFECWCYITTLNSNQTTVMGTLPNSNYAPLYMYANASGYLWVQIGDGTNSNQNIWNVQATSNAITTKTWNHYAVTYNSSSGYIGWINGNNVLSTSTTTSITSKINSVVIGAYGSTTFTSFTNSDGYYALGRISTTQKYTSTFTPSQLYGIESDTFYFFSFQGGVQGTNTFSSIPKTGPSYSNTSSVLYNNNMKWSNRQYLYGFQGYQGYIGSQGSCIGLIGYQGYLGDQGNQGVQGIQGFQGFQGNQGVFGNQGIQGFQGIPSVEGSSYRLTLQTTSFTTSSTNLAFTPISNWTISPTYTSGPTFNEFNYVSGSTFTIPSSGIYMIGFSSKNNITSGQWYYAININNLKTFYSNPTVNSTPQLFEPTQAYWTYAFSIGDQFTLSVLTASSSALTVFSSTNPGYCTIVKLTK